MRRIRWLAWILLALAVVMVGGAFASLALPGSDFLPDRPTLLDFLTVTLVILAFPSVGAYIAWRRPDHPIGWIFCLVGLTVVVGVAATEYVHRATLTEAELPAFIWVAWLGNSTWVVGLGLGLTLVLLLFPTGRVPGPRWRPVLWLSLSVIVVAGLAEATAPGVLDGYEAAGLRNPLGLPEVWTPISDLVRGLGPVVLLLLGLASAVSLVLRFRSARGVERQQLKWFLYPAWIVIVGLALLNIFQNRLSAAWYVLLLGMGGMPLAAGIAILRHRLFDIDLLINRTLVYAAVTVTLGAVYVASVIALQGLLSGFAGGGSLAVAASTLAVAALFQPVRRRIQRAVDRRFYRSRYDAQRTLERFSGRLRDEVDLERLTTELASSVEESLQPASVSVWLRTGRSAR